MMKQYEDMITELSVEAVAQLDVLDKFHERWMRKYGSLFGSTGPEVYSAVFDEIKCMQSEIKKYGGVKPCVSFSATNVTNRD